jgi:antitoxin HicB
MNVSDYHVEVRPLKRELGGGFVAFAPELPGCLSDGESRAITLLNLEDAIQCWIEVALAEGRSFPAPSSLASL